MASHAGATSTRAFVYGADARSELLSHLVASLAFLAPLDRYPVPQRGHLDVARINRAGAPDRMRKVMGILIEAIGFGLLAGIMIGGVMFWGLARR